jgi:membrane fusion protein, copper/silver efflux system
MNRNTLIALGAILVLGAGIFGAYRVGMQQGMAMPSATTSAGADKSAPKSSADSGKKVLYWQDPMAPGQRFDKPGKSPYMDMALVPVYAESAGDDGAVKISSRVAQNFGMRTAEVTTGALQRSVEAVGQVAFDDRAVAVVQARVSGFIEKVYVRAPLDPVVRGQPLADILAPDWVATQEEYLALRNSPQANAALREAARQRLTVLGMPEATFAALEAEGKARTRITLTSPISGVIAELGARDGMAVMPGIMLFRINGLSTVWINADVPESQAAWIKPDSRVEVRVPAYPDEKFTGRIATLLPDVNPTTRTLKARIEIANPQGHLRPGMFVTLDLAQRATQQVLLVPTEAVIQTGQRSVLVVAESGQDGKQQFRPVDVETGAEANGMTEIRKGVERGMKVVISGQFLLDSEASLKSTATRMSDAPAKGDKVHSGEGRVEKISKDSVTLSHGPIPSLQWGAMTMDFKLPKDGLPKGISEGNRVAFEFKPDGKGEFEITSMKPIPDKSIIPDGAKK